MPNAEFLKNAKEAKNDEFYTQYVDIQKEINSYISYNSDTFKNKTVLLPCDDPEWSNFTKFFAQNFTRFGLKKLISTSFAVESKNLKTDYQPTLFESIDPRFDVNKTRVKGKIFTLTRDENNDGKVNLDDLKWDYLNGDGDFRSEEVKLLRDESDIIITNPPFSLFREFVAWIMEAKKQFLVIGNINCITYKEIFPLIKENKAWLGSGMGRWISGFLVPKSYELYGTEARIDEDGNRIVATNNCLWLTNLEHAKRHTKVELSTMSENLKFNKTLLKKLEKYGVSTSEYPKYENYDAIEVPYSEAIPSDYYGAMGVPITFLDKYNPDEFELLWTTDRGGDGHLDQYKTPHERYDAPVINGQGLYKRILIKRRQK